MGRRLVDELNKIVTARGLRLPRPPEICLLFLELLVADRRGKWRREKWACEER
jgi:hypothetical protein